MSESLLAAPVAIDYPSTDGKPMADSDTQRAAIIYAIDALRTWYADRDDVYVSGDLLIYYREGDVEARIAPDAFVVFGVRDHERTSYRLWEEPKAPDWVLEVASRSTWREDVGRKRQVYERLGVAEYWQYDPTGEYLAQRLLGWRLTEGGYAAQPVARWADGTLVLASAILGLEMRARSWGWRCERDPGVGDAGATWWGDAVPRSGDGPAPVEPRRGARTRGAGGRTRRTGGLGSSRVGRARGAGGHAR